MGIAWGVSLERGGSVTLVENLGVWKFERLEGWKVGRLVGW